MAGPVTWAVIADRVSGRVFAVDPQTLRMSRVYEAHAHEKRMDVVEVVGEGQEAPAGAGPNRSGDMGTGAAERPVTQDTFARELANWLDREARRHAFDRLVVVAEPQALGELRNSFAGEMRKRVVAELDKDLSDLDQAQLETKLEDTLRQAARELPG